MSDTIQRFHAPRNIDGLAQIGRTRHSLMGIRYAEGEGGDAAAQAAAAAAAATAAQAATTTTESKPPWGDDPTKFDPDKAWKLIENLRTEATERQTKTDAAIATAAAAAAEKAKKDTLAEFGRLLSGTEPEETDPEKLKAKVTDLSTQIQTKDSDLTKAQADVKAANLSVQVALLAPTLGGNAKLLLSNEDFKTSIASAEPTDEAAITAAITKAIQANAALKAPPSRSGSGEHTGAQTADLKAQLAKAEKDGDSRLAISLKRRIAAAG